MSIQPNSIFQLGDHFLLYGDSTDEKAVEKLLKGKCISLIVSDCPYGISYVESKEGFNKIKKNKIIVNDQAQTDEQYRLFTKKWLEPIKPYLASKNAIYIFNSDKMLFALRDGMLDAGYKFAQLLIWVKNHSVLGRMDYLVQHELIVYGWSGKHAFHKSQDKSVILYPRPDRSPLHPTMKPVGLIRRLILNSSKIGEYVYDPFLGSGTTLLACEQTKRSV